MKDFTDSYLTEAFRKLSLLEADFDFTNQDVDKVDELKTFVDDDIDAPEEEPIIDVEAEKDADLQDSYVGKVIIECDCCHTRLYKNEEDIAVDEETGLANMDEECPVCNGTFGYKVIGKIEPFDAEANFEEPAEDDVPIDGEEPIEGDEPIDDVDVDAEADDVDFNDDDFKEALNKVKDAEKLEKTIIDEGCHINEDDVCPECGKNPCICEKHCNEELLDHGNDNFGLSDYISVDDDESLEDDQKELVNAAGDSIPAINEAKCERCGKDADLDKDGLCDDCQDDLNEGFKKINATSGYETIKKLKQQYPNSVVVSGPTLDTADIAYHNKDTNKAEKLFWPEDKDKIIIVDEFDRAPESVQKELIDYGKQGYNIIALYNNNVNNESLEEGVQIDMNSHVVSSDSPEINVDVNNGEVQITDGFGGAEGEMVAPLEPAEAAEIEAQIAPADDDLVDDAAEIDNLEGDLNDEPGLEGEAPIDGEEIPAEGEEPIEGEEIPEEGEEDFGVEEEDIDDFDEDSFNDMGESYLKRVYDNVKSFITEDVKLENNQLVVEGKITFESGKERKTSFVFENMSTTKRGKTLFEGHNDMFSKSNKSFLLKGSLVDKKFIGESLVYKYTASSINEANEAETVKVCGKVKAK